MSNFKRWALVAVIMMIGVAILAACQPETVTETVEVTRVVTEQVEVEGETVEVTRIVEEVVEVEVTAVPEVVEEVVEPKDLIVCMAQEPDTLYRYNTSMLVASAVRHAIYENLYTSQSYGYQAQGLEKLPSLADGDAELNSVEATAGMIVADATGEVVELAEGVMVTNSDGEVVAFDGTPVMVDQMVVRFTFKPWVWSDGTPVTADDSVYSYELNGDPDTPSGKFAFERTASYEALSDLEVQWTGLPGWRDATYFLNVWNPMPRHQLEGFTAAELLEAEEVNRMPLSSGAFVVDEWVAGDHISLSVNPHFYRASEGLPHLNSVTYRFIPDTNQLIAQLLAGQCDITTQDGTDVTQSPFLIEAENNGLIVAYFQTSTVFEHIDFGIVPYDDRTLWFTDVRVRQAMTMCTDRQSMVDNILYGRSEVIHTYIPSVHPLYPEGLTEWAYDPDAANALLDEAGFVDSDGDGWREHVETGEPFAVTLGTTAGNEMRQQLTQIFKENMVACGIDVTLEYVAAAEWFGSGPEGPLSGRIFDLGEFAWVAGVEPACDLYITSQIPGPVEDGFGGWDAANKPGWSNPAYDAACQSALGSLPGTPEYAENHAEAQRIFSQEVPVIPLFLRLKAAAARPEVLNFGVDPTEGSELWNIAELDLQQ